MTAGQAILLLSLLLASGPAVCDPAGETSFMN